jgi:hypothetical protein
LYKLQLITEAKKVCPDVVIVLGEDLTRFRNASKQLYAFLSSFSWNSRAERLGFDEVWLDVSDLVDSNVATLNLSASFVCQSMIQQWVSHSTQHIMPALFIRRRQTKYMVSSSICHVTVRLHELHACASGIPRKPAVWQVDADCIMVLMLSASIVPRACDTRLHCGCSVSPRFMFHGFASQNTSDNHRQLPAEMTPCVFAYC